jgi:Tfp pilus assembly protein PilO
LIRKNNLQRTRSTTKVEAVRKSTLQKLQITLSVEGAYEDLRRFIYDLETAPIFVVIDSIAIEQNREAGKPVVLNLGLATYYQAANHGS